jgi:hypothetical protein
VLDAGFLKGATTEGDGRVDDVVDVLLGDDYRGFVPGARKVVVVEGPVCLPAMPSSETSPVATTPATAKPSPSPTKS